MPPGTIKSAAGAEMSSAANKLPLASDALGNDCEQPDSRSTALKMLHLPQGSAASATIELTRSDPTKQLSEDAPSTDRPKESSRVPREPAPRPDEEWLAYHEKWPSMRSLGGESEPEPEVSLSQSALLPALHTIAERRQESLADFRVTYQSYAYPKPQPA